MRLASLSLAALALTGCTRILGIEQLTTGDAGPTSGDGAPPGRDSGPVPAQLTVSGALTPVSAGTSVNVIVELHTLDDQLVTSVIGDPATSTYSLVVDTQGAPVRGYVRVQDPQNQVVSTRVYFPKPLEADTDLPVSLFTINDLAMLASTGGVVFSPQPSVLLLFVTDAQGQPVPGAIVDPGGPADLRYAGDTAAPSQQFMATGASGIAWAFNCPPGVRTPAAQSLGLQLLGPTVNVPQAELLVVRLNGTGQ
jgi:hypothetical protein